MSADDLMSSRDVSDPAVVGERAAARVHAWLDKRMAEILELEISVLPTKWRRDPYWLGVVRDAAAFEAISEFEYERTRDPRLLQDLLTDG